MPTHLWYFVIAVQATVQEELDFLILWNPLRYKFFCAVHVKGSFNPSWRFMMFTVPVPLHSQLSLEAFCGSPAIVYLGFLTVNTNRNIALIFILIFLYILSYTVPEVFFLGGGERGWSAVFSVACSEHCPQMIVLPLNTRFIGLHSSVYDFPLPQCRGKGLGVTVKQKCWGLGWKQPPPYVLLVSLESMEGRALSSTAVCCWFRVFPMGHSWSRGRLALSLLW